MLALPLLGVCVCVCVLWVRLFERGKMEEEGGRFEEFGEGGRGKESWQLHIRLLVVVRSYT